MISVPTSAAIGRFLLRWWWLAAAFLLVYSGIVAGLLEQWWTNEDYAHGLFTPFAIAYLAYERRRELLGIAVAPSAFGFPVILLSQVVLIVGFLGAEYFLQRSSMLILFAGTILFLWGWRALFKTAFALILILLAIPLPAIIFNAVALPLQLLASTLAESVLDLLGVAIYREGNILRLPSGLRLNVAEACSGIRSLVSLIALAALMAMLGRFLPMRWWARIAFVLSAVPIALLANAVRVSGTGLLAHKYGGAAAEGFFHSFSGGFVFVFAFAILLLEMFSLQQLKAPGKRDAS